MTRDQVIEATKTAKYFYVGVTGEKGTVYVRTTREIVLSVLEEWNDCGPFELYISEDGLTVQVG